MTFGKWQRHRKNRQKIENLKKIRDEGIIKGKNQCRIEYNTPSCDLQVYQLEALNHEINKPYFNVIPHVFQSA